MRIRRLLLSKAAWVTGLAIILTALFIPTPAQAISLSGDWDLRINSEPGLVIAEAGKFGFELESILDLKLAISGLSLSNTTVLSLAGLEFQAFTLDTTLGPLNIKDTFIFSPNIIEVEDDILKTIIDVSPNPGYIVDIPLLLYTDELGLGSPVDLARILQPTLSEPITLRKKIVELETSLGGLNLKTDFLLADLGTSQAKDWQYGSIFTLSGSTFGDLNIKASTYIGVRQGWECFGVCKPEERFYQGRVVEGLFLTEEKLWIEGLDIGNLTNDIQLVFDIEDPGITKLKVTNHFSIHGFNLKHEAYLEDLELTQDLIKANLAVNNIEVEAIFLDKTGAFEYPIKQLSLAYSVGEIELKGLFYTHSKLDGSLASIKASVPIGETLRLNIHPVFLGGNFYNVTFGMGTKVSGFNIQGLAKFRPGYLLVGTIKISLNF